MGVILNNLMTWSDTLADLDSLKWKMQIQESSAHPRLPLTNHPGIYNISNSSLFSSNLVRILKIKLDLVFVAKAGKERNVFCKVAENFKISFSSFFWKSNSPCPFGQGASVQVFHNNRPLSCSPEIDDCPQAWQDFLLRQFNKIWIYNMYLLLSSMASIWDRTCSRLRRTASK